MCLFNILVDHLFFNWTTENGGKNAAKTVLKWRLGGDRINSQYRLSMMEKLEKDNRNTKVMPGWHSGANAPTQ